MITPEKIEEWIKEAEERPASASAIIQHLANRLRYLVQRNEELQDENIALMSGERVEEYERRIAHLEYQLDLLKRRLGGEISLQDAAGDRVEITESAAARITSLLVYGQRGHILRIPLNPQGLESGVEIASLQADTASIKEPPGMLALRASEELLLVFSSGRVRALPVEWIAAFPAVELATLDKAPIPDEPRGVERLACLVPISRLPQIDSLIQISRKGYAKKIGSSMGESILANQYIGSGVNLPADQTLNVLLCGSEDQMILISYMGYLLCIEPRLVSHSIEQVMRVGKTDHLVSAFQTYPDQSLLIATQSGKLIHRTWDSFEVSTSTNSKGSPMISKARRDQGVRVVGAAAVGQDDWGAALHNDGRITLHAMTDLFARGTIPVEGELLAFTRVSDPTDAIEATGGG